MYKIVDRFVLNLKSLIQTLHHSPQCSKIYKKEVNFPLHLVIKIFQTQQPQTWPRWQATGNIVYVIFFVLIFIYFLEHCVNKYHPKWVNDKQKCQQLQVNLIQTQYALNFEKKSQRFLERIKQLKPTTFMNWF